MLKNYALIALRNLRKHKGYTFINVAGLAIGLACCLLITLYVQHELGYDRYHEKADRIFRLTTEAGVSSTSTHFAGAAAPMAAVMRQEFPEVENAVRIVNGTAIVRLGDQRFKEERFYYADSTICDVFSFKLYQGDARTALARPNTVVLTRSTARKYFGEADPLGETVRVDDGDTYTVTGVVEDVPNQSHFHFDLLASMSSLPSSERDDWLANINYKTYLLLHPDASPKVLEQKFPALIEKNIGPVIKQLGAGFGFRLQPLTEIHLHSNLEGELEPNSDVSYVYIFSAVALFILLIACINFMNLATARSVDRAKEVGMRKVLGARRGQLVRQFLTEALLLTAVAFVLALVLVELVLPPFNALSGRTLQLDIPDNGRVLAGFGGVVLLVGLLAGSYPAFFLSGFRPVSVLKGKFRTSASGAALRKGLVVAQFAISITLIVGTVIVQQQLNYARSQQLGFDKEQVIILPIYQDAAVRERREAFKAEVQAHPDVLGVAGSDHFPGGPADDQVYFPEGRGMDEGIHMWVYRVDFDYLNTLGMELKAGRDFSPLMPTDSSALILNETAMKMLGWDSVENRRFSVLTRATDQPGPEDFATVPVIGVVEDFHFESFRQEIRPMVIRIDEQPGYLLVRARAGRVPHVLAYLEKKWETMEANTPFENTFLDEQFDQLYRADQQLGRIFGYFAGLAILIACLGLFGLAAFAAEQRTKEVGVRKVMGASVSSIVALLSKDFLKLVAIALLIAIPAAYILMNRWLEEFAYRIEIGPSVFIFAGVLALLIALATVSYQSIRAALADPVKSLRYE